MKKAIEKAFSPDEKRILFFYCLSAGGYMIIYCPSDKGLRYLFSRATKEGQWESNVRGPGTPVSSDKTQFYALKPKPKGNKRLFFSGVFPEF